MLADLLGNRALGRSVAAVMLLGMVVASAPARSGNYLVVTAPAYENSDALNDFIAWKSAQGFNVMTYVVPSGTSNTAIRTYIQNLYGSPDQPKYVLLVGDTSGATSTSTTIPHFTGGGDRHGATDLPYACMDAGDDWYPELCVGRFSVTSTSMLRIVVDKSMFVEAGDFSDPEYVTRGAFLANPSTQGMAEPTHDWVIENLFEPNGYVGVKLYSAEGATTQDVTNAVNNGCLWVGYYGHSGSSGWWDPSFNQGNVSALSNEGLYGVAWSFSCNVGNYTLGECFGETWLREDNKGAAAVIFPSNYIYWGSQEAWEPSTVLEHCFFRSFFDSGIWEVGPAWQAGLYKFLTESSAPIGRKRDFFELYNLMGDPALLLPTLNGFTLESNPGSYSVCAPPDVEVAYTIDVGQLGAYSEVVTLSTSGEPAGASVDFSVNDAPVPFTTVMTVGNLDSCAPGSYAIAVLGQATDGKQRTTVVQLDISTAVPSAVTLTSPPDGATDVARMPTLTWDAGPQALEFDVEVAADPNFASIVYSATVTGLSHVVGTMLDSETLYYWHVRAVNGCGDSGFSSAFSFTTTGQADYFTEQFTSGFDLENFSVYLVPNGSGSFYGVCGDTAADFPTDPTGGTTISLADDSSVQISVGGGESVQLYGVAYDSFYVGSNGYITFGSGDTTYNESLGQHFALPRISLLFDDLNPAAGGSVSWLQLADRVAVTYQNVPEYNTSDSNNFQVEMFFDGAIRMTWLTVDSNDSVVGISAGQGIPDDFVVYDLSAAGACVAACCHGYVCYDVDPLDPQDAHNQAQCLADGGAYYSGVTCADNMCDCGGADYRGDANCLGDGVDSYDIDHFIQAVGAPADWLATHTCGLYCANDVNCDGEVNSYDIDGFILCIGQGICEPCP